MPYHLTEPAKYILYIIKNIRNRYKKIKHYPCRRPLESAWANIGHFLHQLDPDIRK